MYTNRRYHLIFATGIILTIIATAIGQEARLGKVDFPTSGSPEAQGHFLRGLAALHSFWYEEAADSFRKATQIDPDFMMGYWGEAMTYNHPLWAQQDTEAARKVISKIKDTPALTARERAYLAAVKALYGDGDKLTRDKAYSRSMEKIHRDYPDDMEASCFYALSLLGTVRPGDKGYRRQAQAGALALEVYNKNSDHPGAAHYIIHSFDDPEHAILALGAARRYADIAPAAAHARHMPSHIFLQLGMWPEAAASNESAWAVSDAWVKSKNLSIGLRDYHSLHWLTYVYLQQGRYNKANELIQLMRAAMSDPKNTPAMHHSYEMMRAHYIVETAMWNLVDKVFGQSESPGATTAAADHAGHQDHSGDKQASAYSAGAGSSLISFISGLAAVEKGLPSAEKAAEMLYEQSKKLSDGGDPYRAKTVQIMALEIEAVTMTGKKNFDKAVDLMTRALAIEDEMSPPSGPPDIVKPPRELFGEILLQAGRPAEARQQFESALLREPNRARSLIGLARAEAKSGASVEAAVTYSDFLKVWSDADAGLSESAEARSYLQQARLLQSKVVSQ
jgi:tetratricopeptide (TPR) repeat protein